MNEIKNQLTRNEIDNLSYNRSSMYDALSSLNLSDTNYDKKRRIIKTEIIDINKRIDRLISGIKNKQ